MKNIVISKKIKTGVLALAIVSQFAVTARAATFKEVWSATLEGPYASLPEHPVTNASFFEAGVNVLKKSAERTLNNSSDVLPYFQKWVHPIGICFSGTWTITEKNPYTGYFAKGSQGLIIVRASEALGQPLKGDYRSFGFAGKLFPTLDPNAKTSYSTANFFTVDDLGGTLADSYLELPKLNEPATSFHLSSLFSFPMITTILNAFSAADKNPGIRPVHAIAELGMENPRSALAPHWMMIQPVSQTTFSETPEDFRNELRLHRFANQSLKFRILVAEQGASEWSTIGKIELNQEALAQGCDHRLHFAHPKSR
ncbi:MAG: hypothetical protein ACKOA8_20720 [Deltaproteobacteria bacterium]